MSLAYFKGRIVFRNQADFAVIDAWIDKGEIAFFSGGNRFVLYVMKFAMGNLDVAPRSIDTVISNFVKHGMADRSIRKIRVKGIAKYISK